MYKLYWQFAAKRQDIFFRRLKLQEPAWTDDPILQRYKFTNVYRASDRVSQFLIRRVIYGDGYPEAANEVVFRVLLFKLFNKISTWISLERMVGTIRWQNFSFDEYDRALRSITAAGEKVYSAAYIIPPVSLSATGIKHHGHLKLIELMMKDGVASRIQSADRLEGVYSILKSYPSLGSFLAFQFTIDLNYSTVINHSEDDFVVAGPGACDGIAKVFEGSTDLDPAHVIRLMAEDQEHGFSKNTAGFQSLWGRRLHLIDCQNLFCELSKYTRVSNPEVAGLSGRTRIKQVFKSQGEAELPWYPPKWDLNDRVHQSQSVAARLKGEVCK
jgi:hypothetical protein